MMRDSSCFIISSRNNRYFLEFDWQIGIDIIAHSKSQVHKIGDRQSLSNLVTILNYSIKDQRFNETCNLEKSVLLMEDWI